MKKTTLSKLLAMMLATAMLMSAAPMTTLAAVGDVTPVTINAVGSKGQANVIGNQDTSVSLKIPSVWPTGYSVSSVGLVPVSALSNPPASSELDGAAIVGFTDARYDTGGGPGSYMVTGIDLSQVIDWSTGNPLAPGLYRAVIWAGPAGGGEEILYSSN
ncbi:MAG: hypothetical protein FWC62_03385, partial [Firmicutes bacterium]|nr:hypothetical protein [Bacillota bacterium]